MSSSFRSLAIHKRSEQFNKFIRERITYTNRQHPSRDVAVKTMAGPRERQLFFGAVREFDTHDTLLSPKSRSIYHILYPTWPLAPQKLVWALLISTAMIQQGWFLCVMSEDVNQ
ncbi:hypothetical protein EDC96DRAFT_574858 [Choanephora cucurbitarum]|nr:hypothetical protein EDC96DRAFT_574858 [Choanephora cucurbitarum]